MNYNMREPVHRVCPGNPGLIFHKRSASCPCLDLEALLSKDMQPTAPRHRRSASDSLASLEKPFFINLPPCASFNIGMESEFGHSLKESERRLLPSKKNSSSDEKPPDSSTETFHQIGTPFISYETGSKKNRRMLVENKSRSNERALLHEMDYINKLKLKIQAEKAELSLLPLQVFRHELIIFQMQKANKALKKKMEVLNRKKADAQAKYRELTKERDSLMMMWMMNDVKGN